MSRSCCRRLKASGRAWVCGFPRFPWPDPAGVTHGKQGNLVTTKICAQCGEEKLLCSFENYRANKPRGRCRKCRKPGNKASQKRRDKLYAAGKAARSRAILRDLVHSAKNKPCSDCGMSYPYFVMDFDHRDPSQKSFTIAFKSTRAGVKAQLIIDEIAKCDVVCANCHRIRTHSHRVAA